MMSSDLNNGSANLPASNDYSITSSVNTTHRTLSRQIQQNVQLKSGSPTKTYNKSRQVNKKIQELIKTNIHPQTFQTYKPIVGAALENSNNAEQFPDPNSNIQKRKTINAINHRNMNIQQQLIFQTNTTMSTSVANSQTNGKRGFMPQVQFISQTSPSGKVSKNSRQNGIKTQLGIQTIKNKEPIKSDQAFQHNSYMIEKIYRQSNQPPINNQQTQPKLPSMGQRKLVQNQQVNSNRASMPTLTNKDSINASQKIIVLPELVVVSSKETESITGQISAKKKSKHTVYRNQQHRQYHTGIPLASKSITDVTSFGLPLQNVQPQGSRQSSNYGINETINSSYDVCGGSTVNQNEDKGHSNSLQLNPTFKNVQKFASMVNFSNEVSEIPYQNQSSQHHMSIKSQKQSEYANQIESNQNLNIQGEELSDKHNKLNKKVPKRSVSVISNLKPLSDQKADGKKLVGKIVTQPLQEQENFQYKNNQGSTVFPDSNQTQSHIQVQKNGQKRYVELYKRKNRYDKYAHNLSQKSTESQPGSPKVLTRNTNSPHRRNIFNNKGSVGMISKQKTDVQSCGDEIYYEEQSSVGCGTCPPLKKQKTKVNGASYPKMSTTAGTAASQTRSTAFTGMVESAGNQKAKMQANNYKARQYSLYLSSTASGGGCISQTSSTASLHNSNQFGLKNYQHAKSKTKYRQQKKVADQMRQKAIKQSANLGNQFTMQSSSPASGSSGIALKLQGLQQNQQLNKNQSTTDIGQSNSQNSKFYPLSTGRIVSTVVEEEMKREEDPSGLEDNEEVLHTNESPTTILRIESKKLPKKIMPTAKQQNSQKPKGQTDYEQQKMNNHMLKNKLNSDQYQTMQKSIRNLHQVQSQTLEEQRDKMSRQSKPRHSSQSIKDKFAMSVKNGVSSPGLNFDDDEMMGPGMKKSDSHINIEVSTEQLRLPLSKDYQQDMSLLMYDFNNSSQRQLGAVHQNLSDLVIHEENSTQQQPQKRNSTPFNENPLAKKISRQRRMTSGTQASNENLPIYVSARTVKEVDEVNQRMEKAKASINQLTSMSGTGVTGFEMKLKSPNFFKKLEQSNLDFVSPSASARLEEPSEDKSQKNRTKSPVFGNNVIEYDF